MQDLPLSSLQAIHWRLITLLRAIGALTAINTLWEVRAHLLVWASELPTQAFGVFYQFLILMVEVFSITLV